MTIKKLGSGPASIICKQFTTNSAYFDNTYVSQAAWLPFNFAIFIIQDNYQENSADGFWFQFRLQLNRKRTDYDNANLLQIYDINNNLVCSINDAGNDTLATLRIYNDTGSATSSSFYIVPTDTTGSHNLCTVHVYTEGGNTIADFFVNTVLIKSVSTAGTNRGFNRAIVYHIAAYDYCYQTVAEWILADEPTFEMRVGQLNYDSAGTETDWGTLPATNTNIGDIGTFNYTVNGNPVLNNVAAVCMNVLGGADGDDIQAVIRKSGVNYASADLNATFHSQSLTAVWEDDPSGGSFGTINELAALEFGIKHVA